MADDPNIISQPSRVGTATPGAQLRSPFDIVAGVESGNRNLTQAIKDINYDPKTGVGNPAQGFWQIIDPTWRIFARRAGVDLNQYPSARAAPRNIQMQVASVIPVNQWGPDSQAALKKAGYSWTGNQTLGQLQSETLNVAPASTMPSAIPASTPGTTLASTPSGLFSPDSEMGKRFPGLTTQQGTQQFEQQAKEAEKDLTGKGEDQKQQEAPRFDLVQPQIQNVPGRMGIAQQASQLMPQLTGVQPGVYGTTVNTPQTGLQGFGGAPYGANPAWMQSGLQQLPGYGTNLMNSMLMAQGYPYSGQFFGGYGNG